MGCPGSGALPPTTARPLGRAVGARYPLAVCAGGVGVGTRHQPTARGVASWLCALWGRHKGAWGGRLLPGRQASGVGRCPTPDRPSFGEGRGPLPTGCGCGGCGSGDPSPTPQRALLPAGFARCGGRTRAPGGGASCLCVGCPGSGALPGPTARPLGRAAGAHYPLAVGAGVETHHQSHSARSCELALHAVGAARGRQGGAPLAWVWVFQGRALSQPRPPVLRGVWPGPATCRLWVRCAAVAARLSLAPFPVPRFFVCCAPFPGLRQPVAVVAWHLSSCPGCDRQRASLACLVAPRWCAAPRPVRSLWVLRSAFVSPWCLPPTWGLSPPAQLAGCAGYFEAGREPGSLCLPLAPAEAMALGALRVVPVSEPRDGVVPGRSLGLQSWAACAAVVWRVWTRSLTRPVSRTVRSSTGDSAGAPGLFCVDADTSSFGSEDDTSGSRACVCACSSWPGRAARPPRRVLVRLTFPVAVLPFFFARPPQGWGCPRLGCFLCGFFLPCLPSSPLAPPLSQAFCPTRPWAPWALALRVRSYPPPPSPFLFPFCSLGFALVSSVLCPLAPPCPLFFVCAPFPPSVPFFCVSFFFLVCSSSCSPPHFFLPFFFPLFCSSFFFARFPRLSCLGFSVVSRPGCPEPRPSVSAHPSRRLPLSLSFFLLLFCPPAFPRLRVLLVLLACVPPGWVPLSFAVCGRVCGVCAVCWGCRLRCFLLVLPCCFLCAGWCCVLLPVVAGC